MQKNISKNLNERDKLKKNIKLFSSEKISLVIICFGILIRVIQYFYNRSLWADEAVLALNIVNRSYLELLQPLDYDQGAPIGFLWIEKLAIQVFGNNEYAFRLFPLLSSIISILIFYQLAKRFLRLEAVPIALAFFVSLNYLVYYATELKQYSSDVFIALLSCLIVIQVATQKLNNIKIAIYSFLGALVIWFSHPAVFTLAGVGGSILLLDTVKRERKSKIFQSLLIYSTWLISFGVFYFVSVQSLNNNSDLMTSWRNGFPSSFYDINWVFNALGKFFYRPLGFVGITDGLAIFAFIVGCISLFQRQKEKLLLLLSPVIATFFASFLHKFPFRNRLVLFLTPFFILLIAEGIDYLIQRRGFKKSFIPGIILLAALLFHPVTTASNLLIQPYQRAEIKQVINYVKSNQQPGDTIYIFQRGHYQFLYYAEKYGYKPDDYIIGVDDLDKYDGRKLSAAEEERYKQDLNKLRGNKRVWLIFSHAHVDSENEMMKSYLDRIGEKTDLFETEGAFVYLYDLS
ncbi:MAG: glycosyltransferase family 39 protein [Cyanobacteriota bacterium]|nr:glycosyltransferase family 39 protein [Cyanobacteriota bacterium]